MVTLDTQMLHVQNYKIRGFQFSCCSMTHEIRENITPSTIWYMLVSVHTYQTGTATVVKLHNVDVIISLSVVCSKGSKRLSFVIIV